MKRNTTTIDNEIKAIEILLERKPGNLTADDLKRLEEEKAMLERQKRN